MSSKGPLILKLFIQHFHGDSPESLLKFLSQEQAKTISEVKLHSTDLFALLHHPKNVIQRLHTSWLEETAKKSSLQPESIQVTEPMQSFIVNTLYSNLDRLPELPIEYLPPTDLAPLASANAKTLSLLCDYLGLFDLAAELRFIVDKISIQNLYACLTPPELTFLKGCLQKKERITVPKLGIDPRKNDSAKWRELIHQRGLLRLTKALAGQNQDFVWYISRLMDYNEGSMLFQQYSPEPIPEVTAILKTQVLQVLNYLKKIGAV